MREIDVVDVGRDPPYPTRALLAALPGFTASVAHTAAFTVVRYLATAGKPVSESFAQLAALALIPASGPVVLLSAQADLAR